MSFQPSGGNRLTQCLKQALAALLSQTHPLCAVVPCSCVEAIFEEEGVLTPPSLRSSLVSRVLPLCSAGRMADDIIIMQGKYRDSADSRNLPTPHSPHRGASVHPSFNGTRETHKRKWRSIGFSRNPDSGTLRFCSSVTSAQSHKSST